MQASRVKNSAMFAREQKNEYDPASVPIVERPLAAGRPLNTQTKGNAVDEHDIDRPRESNGFRGHKRGESQSKIPLISSTKPAPTSPPVTDKTPSPLSSKDQPSPTKSSMSGNPSHNTFPRSFDPNTMTWPEDEDEVVNISPPRALRRQAKSVTFDTAPPEVNEYEMATPDPSSVASGSREGSYEDDEDDDDAIGFHHGDEYREDSFDASLEDTDKTPVVLPEYWRQMSPETANTELADTFEDPFDPDHLGQQTPSKFQRERSESRRTDSLTSDGGHRPLPALPKENPRRESGGLCAAAERVHIAHRSLPTPPRAAQVSKSEILSMKDSKMSLEDRLRLMGIHDSSDDNPQNSAAKEVTRLRKHGLGIHLQEDESVEQDNAAADVPFPRISRESILRKVKSRTFEGSTPECHYDLANLDPDVPIPSREVSSNFDEIPSEIPIKQEEDDEPIDIYSIPEIYSAEPEDGEQTQPTRDSSVIRHSNEQRSDAESCYSPQSPAADTEKASSDTTEDEGPPTPKGNDAIRTSTPQKDGMNLPEFSSLLDDIDFHTGLQSYMSQSSTPPPPLVEKDQPVSNVTNIHQFFQRETTPEEHSRPMTAPELGQAHDEPGTPDSVIRRSWVEEELEQESQFVPDPVATIKAPGGKLKTRHSATPADLSIMVAARREVSDQMTPPIPEKSPRRYSKSLEPEDADEENFDRAAEVEDKRHEDLSSMKLDIPEEALGDDLSFGLDKEFERVIETSKVELYSSFTQFDSRSAIKGNKTGARSMGAEHICGQAFSPQESPTNLYVRTQKGYLMRQNTKVVIAKRNFSNETSDGRPSSAHEIGSRSTPGSPHKASHERTKSWTTEPWNDQVKRKSVRSGSGSKKPMSGAVPPLPGQESAVTGGLEALVEDKVMFGEEDQEEGVERGRLFVKVIQVKDLDLPLPQREQTWFQLTLDNGLHCVTTSQLELGRSASIGQEFELVVLNDLEFQLTLQTKLTPPPKPNAIISNAFKSSSSKSPPKKTGFRNFLSSPKKRREQERLAQKHQEEEEQRIREQERAASRAAATATPTAWDLLHELVGEDGSFGRAYVCLKNHERACYGRQITVDMPVFNEWAMEDASISNSVKSKNGGSVLRRPPYQVGNLTLQLLYVPRPNGTKEDDMPKSMNSALREIAAAEESSVRAWEGILSQQGGDCPVSNL
jgi:hypothetical protein